MRNYLWLLALFTSLANAGDEALIKSAIQAKSESHTAQKVRVVYENLNISDGWALVYGQLLAESNSELDWSVVGDCDPILDKGLWAILRKSPERWDFIEYNACATEPPYWYIELEQNTWPCGIFKDLMIEKNLTLEEKCLASRGESGTSIAK